jgi:uncharacterized protein (TIGR02453 family)
MAFFTPDFSQFFIDLAPNNNKEWFDINRKRYEVSVKDAFKNFVQHLINELAQTNAAFAELEAKDCIFRINRDIRFAKDKSPYKMMVSALISPNGKKSKKADGFYMELGPEHIRVYGGLYELDKEELYTVREAIARDLGVFQQAYKDSLFSAVYQELKGEKNKILPKEFQTAAQQEPLIFNKQWYFYTDLDASLLLSDELDKHVLNCYAAGRSVANYFTDILKNH